MKSFNLFLQDLTADLGELLSAVQSHGRGGSMTLKIKIAPASRGGDVDKITITADRKLELPKAEQPNDFMYLTDDGEPTQAFTNPDADGVITFKEAAK